MSMVPIELLESPAPRSKGFFTDTSVCIGCKACEVACKQWNQLPMDDIIWLGSSYDNTHGLAATTWRHVTYAEVPGAGGPTGREQTAECHRLAKRPHTKRPAHRARRDCPKDCIAPIWLEVAGRAHRWRPCCQRASTSGGPVCVVPR